jgi:DNA-binding NtrC family response regulator
VARQLRSALVVDDDPTIRAGLAAFLRTQSLRVATAANAADALTQLRAAKPDLVVLDVRLPDGDAFTVLEGARKISPAPVRIGLSGEASPEETFRLGLYGVRKFLQKPVSLDDLWSAIRDAVEEPVDLAPHAERAIETMGLRDLLTQVRSAAVRQALAMARGNRTRAAHLLQVTRQAVQQMLRTGASER